MFAHEFEVVAPLSSSVKFDLKRTQIALMLELTLDLIRASFLLFLVCVCDANEIFDTHAGRAAGAITNTYLMHVTNLPF